MKKHNLVYLTTNTFSGKHYVGSHETNDINDGYIGSGVALKDAVKKYGKEQFSRTILKECKTICAARKLEGGYILQYRSLIPNGYNIMPDGGSIRGSTHNHESVKKMKIGIKKYWSDPENRRKQSERLKGVLSGEKHPMYNKAHFKESILKMSENRKGITAKEKHHFWGKKRSLETRKKISRSLKDIAVPEEVKKKLSEASKNVKKITCELCGNEYAPWTIGRHKKKCSKTSI